MVHVRSSLTCNVTDRSYLHDPGHSQQCIRQRLLYSFSPECSSWSNGRLHRLYNWARQWKTYLYSFRSKFPSSFMVHYVSDIVPLSNVVPITSHMVNLVTLLFMCTLQTWHLSISVVDKKNFNRVIRSGQRILHARVR